MCRECLHNHDSSYVLGRRRTSYAPSTYQFLRQTLQIIKNKLQFRCTTFTPTMSNPTHRHTGTQTNGQSGNGMCITCIFKLFERWERVERHGSRSLNLQIKKASMGFSTQVGRGLGWHGLYAEARYHSRRFQWLWWGSQFFAFGLAMLPIQYIVFIFHRHSYYISSHTHAYCNTFSALPRLGIFTLMTVVTNEMLQSLHRQSIHCPSKCQISSSQAQPRASWRVSLRMQPQISKFTAIITNTNTCSMHRLPASLLWSTS